MFTRAFFPLSLCLALAIPRITYAEGGFEILKSCDGEPPVGESVYKSDAVEIFSAPDFASDGYISYTVQSSSEHCNYFIRAKDLDTYFITLKARDDGFPPDLPRLGVHDELSEKIYAVLENSKTELDDVLTAEFSRPDPKAPEYSISMLVIFIKGDFFAASADPSSQGPSSKKFIVPERIDD